MAKKSFNVLQKLGTVILAAALAVTVVPTTFITSEPIVAKAANASAIRDSLNDAQKKIYDAYNYLDSKIMDQGVAISAENKAQFNASNFYTMFTGEAEKKKYSAEDLKFARRAYVYSNPLNIAGAMAELKLFYVKDKDEKYSCYAYLKRISDNNYTGEEKALKNAVNKIMSNIDTDDTNFVIEYQCFNMVLDNVTNVKVDIDNKDLKNTAYGALIQHRASSQGYALAFAALLDNAEISNDILFNGNKCWNQVKIGSKWYETDLVACDKAKKGYIDYERFNTSQSKMKSYGLTRVNYCTKLRESKGTHKETSNRIQKYDESLFKDSHNFGLGVLNADKTVTRTTMLSSEKTANFVPTFKDASQLYDCSLILKAVSITTKPEESAFTWVNWTKEHPYIEITKNGAGQSRILNVTIVIDDIANTTVSFAATINDLDDTTGKFVYQITGEDTVAVSKYTKKNAKSIKIPSTVVVNGKDYKVTKINNNAFKSCKKLETVMLGANITEIGKNAFSGKTKLIRVETLGYNLTKLGKDAFKSADSNTLFLLKGTSRGAYNKLVKKVKKAGGKNSVFKYRAY